LVIDWNAAEYDKTYVTANVLPISQPTYAYA
jgi:hypothetical protein